MIFTLEFLMSFATYLPPYCIYLHFIYKLLHFVDLIYKKEVHLCNINQIKIFV